MLEKEDVAHGCGSRKDDWLAEEEELEAKEEAEMEMASEEKISGGRRRVIGRKARRNVCDSKRRRWRHGSDSLVARVGRAWRLDGRDGVQTDRTSGRSGRIEAASSWRSTKVKRTKVGEESVVG